MPSVAALTLATQYSAVTGKVERSNANDMLLTDHWYHFNELKRDCKRKIDNLNSEQN